MYKGKKFIASFSGGKDSMLAIYRCVLSGMVPVSMITTSPKDEHRSWFHKVSHDTLFNISKSINIPLKIIYTTDTDYSEKFESALREAKESGIDICVFGDIDILEHLEWCTKRCENVGIVPYFPLWQENRKMIVKEVIDKGFKAKIIRVIDEKLQDGFLGEYLSYDIMEKMEKLGVDVCGENGEYHTIVLDGPLFAFKVDLESEVYNEEHF